MGQRHSSVWGSRLENQESCRSNFQEKKILDIQDPQRAKLILQDQRQEKTNVSARVARQEEFLSLFKIFSSLEEGQSHQEDNLLYKSTDSDINLIHQWPHDTPKVTSDRMCGYPIAPSPRDILSAAVLSLWQAFFVLSSGEAQVSST